MQVILPFLYLYVSHIKDNMYAFTTGLVYVYCATCRGYYGAMHTCCHRKGTVTSRQRKYAITSLIERIIVPFLHR